MNQEWPKIVQIIPAEMWRVRFESPNPRNPEHPIPESEWLSAWALLENEDGTRFMDGVMAGDYGLKLVTQITGFVEYKRSDT
ncbi:MAG: hypothetical protein HQL86_06385 [Magnetococcales bacterium]|nr:hypothetical protein [Magnetococcales bacterium]